MSLDYRIAIPSYARPEVIKAKTLHMLDEMDVDRDRILVVCATPEEQERYDASLGNGWRTQVARLGLANARDWYHRHFPAGTRILNMDDDIAGIYEKDGVKVAPYQGSVDDLAEDGFSQCEAAGTKIWGLYPVFNGLFMKDETVVGLRYICGACFGSYAGIPPYPTALAHQNSSGEDFLRTLNSYVRFGAVMRLEYLTYKTAYFAAGGIDQELKNAGIADRQDDHSARLLEIAQQYPGLAIPYHKAGNILNLRLRNISITKIPKDNRAEFVRAMKGVTWQRV